MGRELTGPGKLLYLLLAFAVILPLGCTLFTKEKRKEPTNKPMETPAEEKEIRTLIEEALSPEKTGPPAETNEKKEKPKAEQKKETSPRLARAKQLMARGDYDGAARESQAQLALTEKTPPGDEALFTMALVYAHPKNPKRDLKKALALFQRLLKEHPRSPLAEEAKIWISILQTIEKSKQVDIEIEEMKRDLSR